MTDLYPLVGYFRQALAKLAQGGWRPLIGWGGAFLFGKLYAFAFIDAPERGLVLSDGYYNALNLAFAAYIATFVARGVEKVFDARAPAPTGAAPDAREPVNEHGGAREIDDLGSALPLRI